LNRIVRTFKSAHYVECNSLAPAIAAVVLRYTVPVDSKQLQINNQHHPSVPHMHVADHTGHSMRLT